MSDIEDDDGMDVDVPDVQDAMAFSARGADAKGKRSAANLPVEAEDSLPWFVDDDDISLPYLHVLLMLWAKGRKVQTQHAGRCIGASGHLSDDQ